MSDVIWGDIAPGSIGGMDYSNTPDWNVPYDTGSGPGWTTSPFGNTPFSGDVFSGDQLGGLMDNNPWTSSTGTDSSSGGGIWGAVTDNAPDIIRLAGSIFSGLGGNDNGGGDPSAGFWGQEYQRQATEELDNRAAATYDQIKDIMSDIRGLTGVSTPDAVQNYMTRFDDTMDRFHTIGRQDVEGFSPHISEEYDRLGNRIDAARKQYSLMRDPAFKQAYKDPDAVSPVNTQSIKSTMTLGPEFAHHYDYTDAATQAMIRGREEALPAAANFYANDAAVRELMNYGV